MLQWSGDASTFLQDGCGNGHHGRRQVALRAKLRGWRLQVGCFAAMSEALTASHSLPSGDLPGKGLARWMQWSFC